MTATILVTGASGKLGKLVVDQLLAHKAALETIAVMVRSQEKGQQFVNSGVDVRVGDFNDVDSLQKAVQGIKRALLISSNNVGHRFAEHKNFIDVLKKSDTSIELLAYTSILRADTSPMQLAQDHKQTEEYITKSGLAHSYLRNGWYIENMVEQIGNWDQHGSIIGASKDGRTSAASRKDYAEAAAIVLLSSDVKSLKPYYELGGHPGYTLDELAASASKVLNKPIKAVHLSEHDYKEILLSFGLPEALSTVIADADTQAANGALEDDTNDLEKLLGRPSETIEDVMRAVLQSQKA